MTRTLLLFIVLQVFFSVASKAQCIEGNCESGEGKFLYSDNSIYQGSFLNNKANGFGLCTYSNGNYYKGEWKNHTFEGKGILTYSNGIVYAGIWEKGQLVQKLSPSDIYFNTPMRSIKAIQPPAIAKWRDRSN